MSVPLETISVAMVVTAEYHNPSILNHDFLLKNGIIDSTWGDPSDIVSVPAFSQIKYAKRAIEISCQEERLQFDKQTVAGGDQISDLISSASAYVSTLPHVPYRAFGLNCMFNHTVTQPVAWIANHFLAEGIRTAASDLINLRVGLRYKVNDGTLTVDFRDGSAEEPIVRILTSYEQPLAGNVTIGDAIKSAPDRKRLSEARASELIGG